MEIEQLLDILGNETRREILQMLTKRRCYVSQISEELNIGQKAIIEHLEIMRCAGLLEPHFEKIEKGRPRKYFNVAKNFVIEVNLLSNLFDVRIHLPEMDEKILEDFPRIKELALGLSEAMLDDGEGKTAGIDVIYNELLEERKRLTEAKRVIDFLLNEAKTGLEEESAKERLKQAFR